MRLTNYTNIEQTPVWNEVKDWSDEKKNALITLLYMTMGKPLENEQDEHEKLETFVGSMPKDVLAMASEYAIKEYRAGRCVPHAQAMKMIKERRGWK